MATPQSPQDSYALWRGRIGANRPDLSLADTMVHVGLAQSFLSDIQDVRVQLTQNALNASVLTAVGPALDGLAANVGLRRIQPTPATVTLQFSRANPGDTSTTITIMAGTPVSTGGDGVTVIPQGFATTATVVISSGSATPVTVTATATASGGAGNVAPNSVVLPLVPTGTGTPWTVTNPAQGPTGIGSGALGYTTAGTDGETPSPGLGDIKLRARIQAATAPPYSVAAITSAILAVPGVADTLVVDPQNGNGTLIYYWAMADGTTPGLTGSTITAGTLAAQVDQAVRGADPPNTVPTASAFTVTQVTNVAVSYSAPASIADVLVRPVIQQAVYSYINAVPHGQAPTPYGIINAVTAVVAGLTNLSVTGTTPGTLTPATATEYRASGSPASIVSVTRV